MKSEERDAIIANADAEMRKVLYHPVTVQLNIQTLLGIAGLVQLACRHPGVSAEMRGAAEHFVDGIAASLQEAGLHALVTLVKAGWVQEYDE